MAVTTINFKGKAVTFSELSKICGVKANTLSGRYKAGWRGDELIASRELATIGFKGEVISIVDLAQRCGVGRKTIEYRYNAGYRDDDLVSGTRRKKNVRRKLTDDNVRDIKRLLESSSLTQKEISAKFGVTIFTISHIKAGRSRSDITIDDGMEN